MVRAAKVSGYGIRLRRDDSSDYPVHASVHLAQPGETDHVITYGKRREALLDYLVAHECGHIIRIFSAPPEYRLLPKTSAATKKQVEDELLKGMPAEPRMLALPYRRLLAQMWHEGLVRQVTNFPTDMRIERWLKEEYLGLAEVQEAGVRGQIREARQVLRPRVRRFTHSKVYEASVKMNAAYAWYMMRLYEEPRLFTGYASYSGAAQDLAGPIWSSQDQGAVSDVLETERWASYLELDEWFEGARLEG